jgi:hypothetical protein
LQPRQGWPVGQSSFIFPALNWVEGWEGFGHAAGKPISQMKKTLILLMATLALSGCASRYVITMSNGNQVTATTKPRLDRGYYFFKDAQGRNAYVPVGRVREIARGGTVRESNFSVPPAR